MKVVLSAQGTAAIRVSADDYIPRRGIIQQTLIAFVGNLYQFVLGPHLSPGALPHNPVLIFQGGQLLSENIPIAQIAMFPDGDAATAMNTDLADQVLSDLLSHLDQDLQYRYAEMETKRLYSSALVVEFEKGFVEKAQTIQKILGKLERTFPNRGYSIKRLAFGLQADNQGMQILNQNQPTIMQVIPDDLIIERRAGEPFERNRFFCAAPLTTAEHTEFLEEIERTLIR